MSDNKLTRFLDDFKDVVAMTEWDNFNYIAQRVYTLGKCGNFAMMSQVCLEALDFGSKLVYPYCNLRKYNGPIYHTLLQTNTHTQNLAYDINGYAPINEKLTAYLCKFKFHTEEIKSTELKTCNSEMFVEMVNNANFPFCKRKEEQRTRKVFDLAINKLAEFNPNSYGILKKVSLPTTKEFAERYL